MGSIPSLETMKQLTVFDDRQKIATITAAGNGCIYIFANTSGNWRVMDRTINSYYYPVKKNDPTFLEHVAKQLHEWNYSTELVDE